MALLNPTFLFGVVVLLYLSSFVVFAILRIVTGISIQRIGYFSLRRLAYTPRDGCRVEIRGLGFNIHRPTFAQPTWISLVLQEVVVTVDIRELEASKHAADVADDEPNELTPDEKDDVPLRRHPTARRGQPGLRRSETWKQLTKVKDRIKKLHRNVKWLRMVDVVATNSTVNVVDVGSLQVGSFTVAVDTRRKMVDRAMLFFDRARRRKHQSQAEWIVTLRSVLFTADGQDSLDVLDHALLNVHGFLHESNEGLRDSTLALKLGRLHIPYDDIALCRKLYKRFKKDSKSFGTDDSLDIFLGEVAQEFEMPGSTNEDLVRTVSDSKEFFSSILRGIKEVQFATSFLGVTRKVESVRPNSLPIQLNLSMKEIGIDLHRLDPKSPAHRMYFPSKDIAHEALAAALSISIGLDEGDGKSDRLLYIPMATTTVRTTLPSKTVELSQEGSMEDKNANILFANSIITSPAVDLDPRHLPILIALTQSFKPRGRKRHPDKNHSLISRLLPKANVKFSLHEPVVRIKLRSLEETKDPDAYDLIISSISSISLDVESSHSVVADLHYALDSTLRLQTHRLYYQTNSGERFNLITTESFELKVNLAARPDVTVETSGNVQTCAISMVRQEITDGLRQIVRELRIDVEPDKRVGSKVVKRQNFLRSMPEWLQRFQMDATDFSIDVAGVDEDISDDTRGVSVHLDEMSAEYRAHRMDGLQRRPPRRRTHSKSMTHSDSDLGSTPSSPRSRRRLQNNGDGRRLALHARGMEAQIVEAADRLEVEPFISVPRFELAFSASSDNHGPMFHIVSSIRTIHMQYSLYRHYAVGVAGMTIRKAFMKTGRDVHRPRQEGTSTTEGHLAPPATPGAITDVNGVSTVTPELVTVDVKAALVQVKADMPHEPAVMLHIYGLETGRHRWSTPYLSSKLIRLYAAPPRMNHVWARMISIKDGRVDLRKSKRKTAFSGLVEENMIDIVSEAIRVAVPHEVIVNRITDNFINMFKAVAQLHHRFKTGTNEYILEKHPEGPKNVPKMSIRTRNFWFELEDGAFEWKLGMIYRTGRVEQMQRLAREEAFRVKARRVREEQASRGSKHRSRSAHQRGRTEHSHAHSSWFRSRSLDAKTQGDGRGLRSSRVPRYAPESESLGVHGHAKATEGEARHRLDMLNAQSWKKRIDRALKMSHDSMKELRGTFWGPNHLPEDLVETENILEVPHRPALMSVMVSDLHFAINKPSFAMSELPDFLHKVGKGMPRDMQYGLLVPMHVTIEMDEARVSLRDYPLPLLHIPGMKVGQSTRQSAVVLKTNFVLAEEFRGSESTRRIRVNIVPPKSSDPAASNEGSFAIEVRRTIGPLKTYSDVFMNINTALPTRITWGPCYQPAVQDMMMAFESFTKPQIDPSERVGFWDKLRLIFHSRIQVAWQGDGDMHLTLKGTRDPYQVTGNGAGFLMCWRNDVRWNINLEDDPKRFMTVDSGEYVLAIPDFSHQVRDAARRQGDEDTHLTEDTFKTGAVFKKVVMKLSGKVQWMLGMVFEQAIEDGKRNFAFRPHYDVVLKAPQFAKAVDGLPYDAMRGFRSRHIHLSIAVRAPVDRDWLSEKPGPSRSYNTVHLTPRFFTHFFAWWRLFSQPMSLPIRQGNLFPGREKNSKKFGRHLATVKYSLLLAPLFMSHIYKHKDVEDYAENSVSATGLKVRFDSFMLDLHQRREEFNTIGKTKGAPSRTSGIKIHAGQLDLANADIRAVSASLKGTTSEAIKKGTIGSLVLDQDEKPDLSSFTIPDNDYSWIDMDDFVELDWILPTEAHPETKIMPLASIPRLTYFRQMDIGGMIAGDPSRTSPFGNEPTHFCIMSQDDDPRRVQKELIEGRLDQLEQQMQTHARNVGEAELKCIQCDNKDLETLADYDAMRKHTHVLKEKRSYLEMMLQQMEPRIVSNGDANGSSSVADEHEMNMADETMHIPSNAEFQSDFKNRFVIHNMQLKWNNLLRNIVLRYIHQNSQRRGFIYYLSRPAVKFILDIVEEQSKFKREKPAKSQTAPVSGASSSPDVSAASEKDSTQDIEDRIRSILGEGTKFKNTEFGADPVDGSIEDLGNGLSNEYSPQNSFHIRLIAPQIQLQSDKNKKHVVLVTAKGMELKVLEVMDKERVSDNVSGLVQRRFLVKQDSLQFFVTHQKWFQTNLVSMYTGSKYGAPGGSSWPPWVPMEVMFDFVSDPFGFKRVVQKTSALLRYDKYNTLRLKYNNEVNSSDDTKACKDSPENRMDNLWVEFPQARALCNSSQYYAMYVIVLDLLMYSEPLEKTRSERLEKIMLASDFSDLSGAPEMVMKLQDRIRQLEEIKAHFQTYAPHLDKRGWEDRLHLERDLAACEDELFFMMKAITTSQRKFDMHADSNALLKWSISARDIVWHLMQDSNEPLVEMQLKDLEYDRTDNSDGSHMNLIRVGKLLGLNLLPDATYPEIITPYHGNDSKGQLQEPQSKDMIRVYWYMLEAIAGIPVMDRFEVDLFPVRIQLEREIGKRLFDYIFPGLDGDKGDGKSNATKSDNAPVMIKPDLDDDAASINSSTSRLATPSTDKDGGFSTRPGSLELRLRPTLTSNSVSQPPGSPKRVGTGHSGETHTFRLFRSSGTGKTSLHKKASHDSLRGSTPKAVARSSTGFSSRDGGRDSMTSDGKKASRFGLTKRAEEVKREQSDDLTKMITRASNYMTFAYIKMPSVVLCLSYKGKDHRNFEDVHDFVFRMPALEWQNKTWSNLDLALALKKAVVKALISHTGAIIGNKFSKHRPNTEQRNKLRELVNSSVMIAPSSSAGSQHYAGSIDSDDSSSLYGTSPVDYSRSPPRSLRGSTHSSIAPARSQSRSSSVASSRSRQSSRNKGPGVPAYLTMTPPTPVERRETAGRGFDFDMLRPGSSHSSNHRRMLRDSYHGEHRGHHTQHHDRPSTSSSSLMEGDRRRSGGTPGGGLRDKISALTHRMSLREPSGLADEDGETTEDGRESGKDNRPTMSKRLSWAPRKP